MRGLGRTLPGRPPLDARRSHLRRIGDPPRRRLLALSFPFHIPQLQGQEDMMITTLFLAFTMSTATTPAGAGIDQQHRITVAQAGTGSGSSGTTTPGSIFFFQAEDGI